MSVKIKEGYIGIEDDKYIKIIIFNYEGDGDPVNDINESVSKYMRKYNWNHTNEFVDINMDNPWVRIVTIEMSKEEMRDQKVVDITQN